MAYKIQYDTTKYEKGNRIKRSIKCIGIVCSIFLFIIALSAVKQNKIHRMLIPGDSKITSVAFTDMAMDIRQGKGVREAFGEFCTEIMENAKIS